MIVLQRYAAGTSPVLPAEQDASYSGLITRGIAFALDAVVINVAAIVLGVGAALILSLLHLPSGVKALLAGIGSAAYVLWLVGYFVFFWSTTGQTIGARAMQFKVQTRESGPISPHRALVRCGGLFLAALPLFLGFVPILYDARRRGLQDRLAGTVVVSAPAVSMIEARRERKREQYLAASRRAVGPIAAAGVGTGGAAGLASASDLLESLRDDDPGSRFEQGEM